MVIWSKFRMRKYRDGDHREDAPHFNISREILKNNKIMILEMIPAALFSDHFLIISGKWPNTSLSWLHRFKFETQNDFNWF